jgi:polyisoprenyl-phosphate glycosyltransferase
MEKLDKKLYKVSIVVPCYNEEGNIQLLYDRLVSVLTGQDFEIIFVDDNSNDDTLNKLIELSSLDNKVKYISFSRNFGHQIALRAGLEYAKGDCTISMDGDLQHPPELIPSLIEKWKEGYDIVYTIRKDTENVSFFKKTTANFFYRLMNSLAEIEVNQGSADFRLLDKRIVNVLVNDIKEYHLFYRGLISWIGFKQYSIDYVPHKRFSGVSKYSFRKMLNFALNGITSFSIKPLKISIFLGVLLSIFSAMYGVYVLYISLFTDTTVKGWASVLVSVLFIGGINMILLGIIGEYLGKLYIQSKNRPYFLIKKTNYE